MYSGRHGGERLFRRTGRLGALASTIGAAAVKDRRLPQHGVRRVGGTLGMALAMVALSVASPVTLSGTTEGRASTLPADGGTSPIATALQPLPAAPGAPAPTRPRVPNAPRALPATGLMSAPPLPSARGQAGRSVLFTFDDGPDPTFTPQVLALLAKYDAHAVFCVVGQEAQQHPDVVRAIVRAGHDLCNHTTHHDQDVALKPGAAIYADLRTTQGILLGISGVVPRYFRAPGGRWSPTLVAEAHALELQPLDWSVDPRDWAKPGLRHVVDTVLREVRPGGVVVMHDGGGDRTQGVLALSFLLRRLDQLGYDFR